MFFQLKAGSITKEELFAKLSSLQVGALELPKFAARLTHAALLSDQSYAEI
jgi:hypothetical protein